MKKWAIMFCDDCNGHFAINEEPDFQTCPYCGGDETTGTGEYLLNELVNEDGEKF